MKFADTIKRSGRNLAQAKIRTLLTALAIAVGGFTLTITLSAANGARQYADRLVNANFDPSSLVVAKDDETFSASGGTQPQEYSDDLANVFGGLFKQLTAEDIAKLESLPHVDEVIQNYNMATQFITRDGAKRYTGFMNVHDPAQHLEVVAGQTPERLLAGQTLLPDAYIDLLGFGSAHEAVGQTITVQIRQLVSGHTSTKEYEIVGITTKSSLSIDFAQVGPYFVANDVAAAYQFANAGTPLAQQVPTATLRGDGQISPDELKSTIIAAGYAARTADDLQGIINQFITVLQSIILVFGFITLVASFFGVVNTQYISVLERTREIGLMKALGMSRGAVSRLFVVEATWIGFLGAALGSGLALVVGTAVNPVISNLINFGSERLLIFSALQILALVLFLMLVTTIAGLLPARKAAKLDPIEALRTE